MPTATLNQLPAPLNVNLVAGDEINFTLRFKSGATTPFDLTGYTITAKVFVSRTRSGATSPPAVGTEVLTFSQTVAATAGEVLLGLTETQTAQLQSADVLAWRWYCRWVSPGGVTRTVASGAIVGGTP
jgi:hypothetical protein